MYKIGKDQLANMFCTTEEELYESSLCSNLIKEYNLEYGLPTKQERNSLILKIFKKLDSNELKETGVHRKEEWEHSWQENCNAFIKSNFNIDSPYPKYFKDFVPMTLNGNFIMPTVSQFEIKYLQIF